MVDGDLTMEDIMEAVKVLDHIDSPEERDRKQKAFDALPPAQKLAALHFYSPQTFWMAVGARFEK